MDILTALCSVPTAPFVEGRVVAFVEEFVRARKGLRLSRDDDGNLLIEARGTQRGAARWVFTAHMDHPGFVARAMTDDRTLTADFRGAVLASYVLGSKVRFFPDGAAEIRGTVTDVVAQAKGTPWAKSATIAVARPVPPNAPGMFDQGVGRVKGKRFYSRVCDDLAGAAAALAMIDELARKPAPSPVAVLLTRAEEAGFIGAIAAVLKPRLLTKDDRIVAIETSAEQPYAPQGKGAIIRIGDRTSVFNSSLSYFMTQQAEALKKRDAAFAYQRALMPGGTCEATVYDVWGYHAGSICVALGNYHNMDRAKEAIGPEYIDLADWANMVKLFLRVARQGHAYEPGHVELRKRLEKRFKASARLLAPPKGRGGAGGQAGS